MALTKADKEFIELSLKPITQTLENIQKTNSKQDERLEKLEGENRESEKVFITMDEWVKTRGLTCPNNDRIKEVEKVQNNNKVTKKFVFKVFGWIAGLATFSFTAIRLIEHFF